MIIAERVFDSVNIVPFKYGLPNLVGPTVLALHPTESVAADTTDESDSVINGENAEHACTTETNGLKMIN